jgi:hypothetical protein
VRWEGTAADGCPSGTSCAYLTGGSKGPGCCPGTAALRSGRLDVGLLDDPFDDLCDDVLLARFLASACWLTSTRAACHADQ